jgi:hypothetical protein
MFKGNVLALDLATVSGYAWGKPNGTPKFGHVRLAKAGESRVIAYKRFRLWLDLWCSAHKTEIICFESPVATFLPNTSINTIKLLIGLCEHLEFWALEHGIELREASVAAVRSHFIGRNLRSAIAKPLVLAKCRERGWMAETTDESDALALLDYQISCLRPEIGTKSTPLFSEHSH